LIHQLIEKADLPYSLGLSIDTSRFGGWVSELYVWASIAGATEGGDLKGGPEAGIRTTLHDWHKPDFDGVVFPLFEHTIGLKEGARDLWSQAADAAKSLMPH
jgi:hypothetical protein